MNHNQFTTHKKHIMATLFLCCFYDASILAQVCNVPELQKVFPVAESGVGFGGGFGVSVSMQGHWAIVGANGTESAYIFRLEDNNTPSDPTDDVWVEHTLLTASDSVLFGGFGDSVSMEGKRAIVGASGNNEGVYVFYRDDNDTPTILEDDVWIEETKLITSDNQLDIRFGYAVVLNGLRIAIGAPQDDDHGMDSGAVYVFHLNDNSTTTDFSDDFWEEEAKLTAKDTEAGDHFGSSVALNEELLVIGASGDNGAGTSAGSVSIFRLDDNNTPTNFTDDNWIEESKLRIDTATLNIVFGTSVSVNNDRVLVGAFFDGSQEIRTGAAYVFHLDDNDTPSIEDDIWINEERLTASDGMDDDNFGVSVTINGDYAVIGASLTDGNGDKSGTAYLYQRFNNNTPSNPNDDFWEEVSKLTSIDAETNDHFGLSVSMDDHKIIVSAAGDRDESEKILGSISYFSVDQRCLSLIDFVGFQNCFSGEMSFVADECNIFDMNNNSTIDQIDYKIFLQSLIGP